MLLFGFFFAIIGKISYKYSKNRLINAAYYSFLVLIVLLFVAHFVD